MAGGGADRGPAGVLSCASFQPRILAGHVPWLAGAFFACKATEPAVSAQQVATHMLRLCFLPVSLHEGVGDLQHCDELLFFVLRMPCLLAERPNASMRLPGSLGQVWVSS